MSAIRHPFLDDAIARNASDITLCPGEPVTLRISTRLHRADPITAMEFQVLQSTFAPNASNHAVGSFTYAEERFRYIYYVAEGGPVLELRHLPKEIRSLETLAVPPAFLPLVRTDRGLIIVTGATGEGKSTTLAAAIDHLNATRGDCKIITLENPIEYRHPSRKALVRQRELGQHFATFPEAIDAAMRQDPDIIMVGEMRGPASMAAALTAAETGQLVFATLHTRDAAGSVSRILDACPGSDVLAQLAGSLVGVLAQQLLETSDGKLAAAFELLVSTPAVAHCIREKRIDHLRDEIKRGAQHGMVSMDSSLESLVRLGRVRKADALHRAIHRPQLEARLAHLPP